MTKTINTQTPSTADLVAFTEQLGIEPDVFRLQWSRTIQLGDAGYVTVSLDLDVRKLSEQDRAFIVGPEISRPRTQQVHAASTYAAYSIGKRVRHVSVSASNERAEHCSTRSVNSITTCSGSRLRA